MKKFLLTFSIVVASMFAAEEAVAQIKAGEGQVSISLESNNILYFNDKNLIEFNSKNEREKPFGSIDYLKVDYSKGRFSAGVQIDGYLPSLSGYDITEYQKSQLPGFGDKATPVTAFFTKYIQWEDQNWGVRLGDIYDQFGNGLIFRAYEERALAFNNALAGARAYYNLNNYFNVKVVAGMPRLYDMRVANWIYGADLSLSLSDIIGWNNGLVSVEGSYVGRNQKDATKLGLESDYLNMLSGRLNFETAGFTFRGEYVAKLNEDIHNRLWPASKGHVAHVDLGYNYKRFSASATFRYQKNMNTPILVSMNDLYGGNVMSYIPLLTRQHTYMLANLNPYRGTTVFTAGEIGGQADVYYSLRNKKARGKYWNFHANISVFNTIKHKMNGKGKTIDGRNAWIDFNFDVERQWNKSLKTTFLYSFQRWDESLNHWDSEAISAEYCASHIFVGDVTYKFNKKHSLRVEAQYLASDDYEGDWVAGLVEYNFAPMFSFYVSDMWNCEKMEANYNSNTDKNYLLHYYQVGMTFTHSHYRAQLAYGRNRAGYVCSGGACRYQPAYTGVNLALTITF